MRNTGAQCITQAPADFGLILKLAGAFCVSGQLKVAVLAMLLGAAAVLNGKFGAMMQAGKAHDALLFDPDGLFVLMV